MPIYLVRWPDLSAALVRADGEVGLLSILDQVANPEGCEWIEYDGPLALDVRLPAAWRVHPEGRPGPVQPEEIVIGDLGPLAVQPVVEALEVSFAGDDGWELADAILAWAFPAVHATVERLHATEAVEPDAPLPPGELRAALHSELARMLTATWRRAQIAKSRDPMAQIARELDMPVQLARVYAEQAAASVAARFAGPDGPEAPVAEAGPAGALLQIPNHHGEAGGSPPRIDGDAPGSYVGYFANEHGEQAIYTYEHATGRARLQLGDAGWEQVYAVQDGAAEGLVLTKAERVWLQACWMATGALRQPS